MSKKKQPQRDRVLEMLKAGPVTSEQFMRAFIPRYSARIFELRAAGYVIDGHRLDDKQTFRFTLVSSPAVAA